MMKTIDHISLTQTIKELQGLGKNKLAERLNKIILHNELEKPEKHNCKADKTTSFYFIDLNQEELKMLDTIFIELLAQSFDEDGEPGLKTSHYEDLCILWSEKLSE